VRNLYVYKPKVENDTVFFSWNYNHDPKIFRKNEFYIKYDGIDITDIDPQMFYEIFISLMVPVFKAHEEELLIILPEAIPNETVNFWLSYNEADNINVFPTKSGWELPKLETKNPVDNKKIGILFGGGKDSLYSYKLNNEIFGSENILIVSYVFPIDYSQLKKLDTRRENFALSQFRENGTSVQKIYTDFRSKFAIYSYFNRTHTQLYYSMSYPLYVKYGLSYLTYSYEFTEYWTKDHNNNPAYRFKKSRPEFDMLVSNYLDRRLENPTRIFNSNYYLSETLAFKLLNERYNAVENIMMCEADVSPDKKYCMKCKKCGEFVLYSLCYKHEIADLDLNYFLTESNFILKTMRQTEENQNGRNKDGNIQWFDGLISPIHYMSFCHIIHSIDAAYWEPRLNKEALDNLLKLKDWYGNKEYKILDQYMLEALKKLNLPFESKIKEILDQHTSPNTSEVVDILFANTDVKINYGVSYPVYYSDKNRVKGSLVANEIIENSIPSFHSRLDSKINHYNSESKQEIPLFLEMNHNGLTFYIDKSAPKKGDTVEVTYLLSELKINNYYHVDLRLLSPHKSKEYNNRFKYKVLIDNEVVLEEDMSLWNNDNSINIYFKSTSTSHSLTISVESLYNCEPWNWGKASSLIIKELNIESVAEMEANFISVSSPYSKVNSNWRN
jgi:hypothetical protein